MPPFLPVRALNRNQNVRIGGQKLSGFRNTYVDLGQLAIPTGVLTPVETTTGGTGLASGQAYFYVLTATDAFGGETPPSAEVTLTTSADTTSYLSLRWLPVPNATGYNVYRGTATGVYAFIANVSGGAAYDDGQTAAQNLATYSVVVSTTNPGINQLGVANTVPPPTNNTFVGGQTNTRRELQQHSAIGAILIGTPVNAATDIVLHTVPTLTLATLTVTPGAGELKNNRTGGYLSTLTTTNVMVTKPSAGSERIDTQVLFPNGLIGNFTGPVVTVAGTAILPTINTQNAGTVVVTPVTTTTASPANVLQVANTTGLQIGMACVATGVPNTSRNFTYITAITPSTAAGGGTVTLSANATASATVTATFTVVVPIAYFLVNNTAATPMGFASAAAPFVTAPRP